MEILTFIGLSIGITLVNLLLIYRNVNLYKRTTKIVLHQTIDKFITIVWKILDATNADEIIVQRNLEDFAKENNGKKTLMRTSDGYNYGMMSNDKKTAYLGCNIFHAAVVESSNSSEYKVILNC